MALPADEVGMLPGFAVITRHGVQGINLDHHAFLAQNLQRLVHGVKRDGRDLPPHLLIKVIRGGMVPPFLECRHHRQSLRGHGNPAFPQLLDEIFHDYY
jgi:hypothetical protein